MWRGLFFFATGCELWYSVYMITVLQHTPFVALVHGVCGALVGMLLSRAELRLETRGVGLQSSCGRSCQIGRCAVAACGTGIAFFCLCLCTDSLLELVELEAFCCVLLFLSLVDARRRIIPNACIGAGAAIRLCYLVVMLARGSVTWSEVGFYTLGALAGGAALLMSVLAAGRLLGQEAMGAGDIKLLTLLAWYVGWQQWLLLIVSSCLLGLATFALMRMQAFLGHARASPAGNHGATATDATFPFGPAIAVAFVITVVCGQQAVDWYAAMLAG